MSQWDPLQYSVGSAFLALVYSDYMLTSRTRNLYCDGKLYEPTDIRNFATMQVFYGTYLKLCCEGPGLQSDK